MSAKQIDAYKTAQKAVMSGREIEASALTKAANILKEIQRQLGYAGSRRGAHPGTQVQPGTMEYIPG